MFVRLFFVFSLIHLVTSNINQEDLAISKPFHIGCLTLNSDKKLINDGFQEDPSSPYQTFSSPNLTIDLCFRLCQRRTVLMNTNHTNCICLNTLNQLYDIDEHLGDVLPKANCTANALEIHSLIEQPYILPPPTPKTMDDWSIEGCYVLDSVQTKPAKLSLVKSNHTLALNSCREHCQKMNNATQFSFYLSSKKSCYCEPIKTTPVRKPLIHCSFLPYIKNAFNNSFNESSVHADTAVKINVQRYCSPSFVFDRNLYRCSRIVLVNQSGTHLRATANDACSPITVKTNEQYNHLLSLLRPSLSRIFIWINRDSTYLFDDLFKSKVSSLPPSGDLCLVIHQTKSASNDLMACSAAQSSDYNFCAQKPMQTKENKRLEFQSKQPTPISNDVKCPTDFTLFDNRCYYVDKSSVDTVQAGEEVCSDKSKGSTLLKFDLPESSNADTAEFLGRTFDNVLLELFYYQLEKKLNVQSKNASSKDGLRLLVYDNNDQNECALRSYNRSTGSFVTSSGCDAGGYPVCRSEPVEIPQISINESEADTDLEKEDIDTFTVALPDETVNVYSNNRDNVVPNVNGTVSEDINNNDDNSIPSNSTSLEKPPASGMSWHTIGMILLIALVALIGTAFLIYHLRQGRGGYSTRLRKARSNPRTAQTTSAVNGNETTTTKTVAYTRVETSPPPIPMDEKVISSVENSHAIIEVSNEHL